MMKTGRKIVVASLILFSLVCVVFRLTSSHASEEGNSLPATEAMSVPDLKDIRDYKTWTRVHATPLLLPAPLDALCRMPSLKDSVETSTNPHRRKYFTVYVNEIGRQAMMSEIKPAFPEGSIIVKEKLLAADSASPELLTVMVKREKGFNQESGDWEYMVVDGEQTKIEGRGKLANCQSCHALQSKTDYVFRSYLPEDVRQSLR